MIRMFMAGLNMVSKTPFPQKAFSSIEEALVWAQRLPGQTAEVAQIRADTVAAHFGIGSAK